MPAVPDPSERVILRLHQNSRRFLRNLVGALYLFGFLLVLALLWVLLRRNIP